MSTAQRRARSAPTPEPTPTSATNARRSRRSRPPAGAKDPLRGSRASGMWAAMVLLVVVLVLVSVFVMQNTQSVTISYFGWTGAGAARGCPAHRRGSGTAARRRRRLDPDPPAAAAGAPRAEARPLRARRMGRVPGGGTAKRLVFETIGWILVVAGRGCAGAARARPADALRRHGDPLAAVRVGGEAAAPGRGAGPARRGRGGADLAPHRYVNLGRVLADGHRARSGSSARRRPAGGRSGSAGGCSAAGRPG